jgi:hypothetical protein
MNFTNMNTPFASSLKWKALDKQKNVNRVSEFRKMLHTVGHTVDCEQVMAPAGYIEHLTGRKLL